MKGLDGTTALLAIEIADSTLAYDLGRKMAIYAHFGIRELWVMDIQAMVTHVHRSPREWGYSAVTVHAADELLTPVLIPGLAVKLVEFGFEAE